MRANLTCRCGVKIPVTREQANSTVQCRSCLNRIHVPSEKILVDLNALHRDIRLRAAGFLVIGVLALFAIAAGVFTQSKRDSLVAEARSAINGELNEKRGLPMHISELKSKNPQSAEIGHLEEDVTRLQSLQSDPREIKERLAEVKGTLNSIDPEFRTPGTRSWLADADFADFTEKLLYGFVIGAGVVFLFLIVISARVSTHRHRIVAYEKQGHTKIISR